MAPHKIHIVDTCRSTGQCILDFKQSNSINYYRTVKWTLASTPARVNNVAELLTGVRVKIVLKHSES